jgi:RNA polymerase sigma-70 factor, ECF subfamily
MPTTSTVPELDRVLEQHRAELTGYCLRMLGSPFEAEDAVQDTLIRGWRHIDSFEGRSSLRSWLYRIATNVCNDMLRGRQRTPQPIDVSDDNIAGEPNDPADLVAEREDTRNAFAAVLVVLPARQRAVVILHDVLHWEAAEVAALLETSAAAVNSLLQRARTRLAGTSLRSDRDDSFGPDRHVVAQYVDAFERYDVSQVATLLRDEALAVA